MSNYTDNLEILLIQKDWKGADIETERLVFSLCNYQEQEWLKAEDIDFIPLDILAHIEKLWTTHSQGRFGFRVQEQVHRRIRADVNTNPRDIFKRMVSDILRGSSDSMNDKEVLMVPYFYGVEIGWIEGHPMDFLGAYGRQKSYEELTFDLTAPIGHLPCQIWWTLNYQAKKIPLNVLFKKYGILGIPGSLCKYICSLELLLFKRIKIACQQDIRVYFSRANTHYESGRWQDAIKDYSQVLQIDSNNADAYYKRGNAHYYLGNTQAAIENYTQAIKLNNNYIAAYYQRSEIYSKLGYKLAVIEDLTTIIEIAPNEVSAYFTLGNIYYNLGLYQDAIWDYTQIIKNIPTHTYAYYNRGLACYNLGDNQGAIKDFTYLIQLSPRDANNYYYRGLARSNAGENEGAIKDFSTMIAINSNDAQAYFKRGVMYYNLGLYQDAIRDYNQSIKIIPTYANTYYNRGLTLLSLGKKQEAIDDFKKAASIYKQENNINDYNETLERLKNIQYDDVELKSAVGMNYTRLRDLLAAGMWKEADEETTRVMLAVAKREHLGSLDFNSIDNFPCEDLATIDQLWINYSNGRFGFSIQKSIYQNLGGTKEHNSIISQAFGYAVGWKTATEWFYYSDITFDINAPEGHLPRQVLVEESEGFLVCFFYIFSRVEIFYIPNPKSKIQNSKLPELDDIGLISSVGMDYRKLRDLLAAENWKEADMETARVMSNVAKLVEVGGLKRKYITNFPSKDLQTIDQLWVKYSYGNFGFSVQKKIYQEMGGVKHYDDDIWEAFIDEVGWIRWGRSNWYSNVTFKKTAPQGHLPWQVTSVGSGRLWGWEGFLLSHRDL